MYHINPACIKRILKSMPKNQVLHEMKKIEKKLQSTPPGNERMKYLKLYKWCHQLTTSQRLS